MQKIGVDMHQFQHKTYRQVLKELQENDEILQQAEKAGPEFRGKRFAELTGE